MRKIKAHILIANIQTNEWGRENGEWLMENGMPLHRDGRMGNGWKVVNSEWGTDLGKARSAWTRMDKPKGMGKGCLWVQESWEAWLRPTVNGAGINIEQKLPCLSRETIVVQNSISSDSHRWSVQWRFETALHEAQMF